MSSYPCPFCGAQASLETGCPACGRPPDPDAAEVTRLDGVAAGLLNEVETARRAMEAATGAYNDAVQRLAAVKAQRNKRAAGVRAARERELVFTTTTADRPTAGAPPLHGAAAAAPTDASAAPAAEASPRTVQNLLFILGGLMLGSAAVVFTAVAWASFGVAGRAAILAIVTILTLLVPPFAVRRQLAATAETFAALGLLLVLLDGYAAWYVNLVGVADTVGRAAYAATVFAGTALVAAGYGVLTGLRGPRLAALAAGQPVLPLIAADLELGATGWASMLTAQAGANLLVARHSARVLRAIAWLLAGLSTLVAAPAAVVALVTAVGPAPVLAAASANLAVAAVIVLAGAFAGTRWLPVGAGVAVGVVGWVASELATELTPRYAGLTFGVAVAAIAATTLRLPGLVRSGARVGALVVAGVYAAALLTSAAVAAAWTVAAASPAWHGGTGPTTMFFDWTVVAATLLVAAAVAMLVRRHGVAVVAAVVVAFAIPGALALRWWAPPVLDGAAMVGLAAAATVLRRPALAASGSLVAGVHMVLTASARPGGTLVALAVLLVAAAVVARRSPVRELEDTATVAGVLAAPGLTAAAARLMFGDAALLTVPAPLVGALLGLALATVTLLALGWRPLASAAGVSLAGTGVTIAALAADGVPFGVIGAAALVCAVIAALPARTAQQPAPTQARLAAVYAPAVVPLIAALAAVAPAVIEVLLRPYGWLADIWAGTPAGVGLAPDAADRVALGPAFGAGPAAVALALLAVPTAIGGLLLGRSTSPRWTAIKWAAAPVSLALMLGCTALGAPWPVVPVVSLATGLVLALLAALRPGSSAPGAVLCWFTVGSGLAGSLATRPMTLIALSAIVVVAGVCGAAGRNLPARVAGWAVAAGSAAWLAIAGARAADLALHWVGYWLLVPAATALAVSTLLHIRPPRTADEGAREGTAPGRALEARVLEAAAHGTALVALLLTLATAGYAAGICTLWGIALGLGALRTPDGRVVRAAAGAGAQLLAYWLLLAANQVTLTEAYTVPAAAAAVLAGWLAARWRPDLNSWEAYGPALLAGFAPSLATVLVVEGEPLRRLALGVAAVAVVLVGARWRLKAPLLVGGGVLVALAVHELVLYWDYLPRWVPLAVAGLLLVGIATTYERRLREFARLRGAVAHMR